MGGPLPPLAGLNKGVNVQIHRFYYHKKVPALFGNTLDYTKDILLLDKQ